MAKTAILVDGGFYRKRAELLWGKKPPEDRALELRRYCQAHIKTLDGLSLDNYTAFFIMIAHQLIRRYFTLSLTEL